MEACPYGPRAFYGGDGAYYENGRTPFEEAKQHFPEGIVMKCNFCVARVDQGLDPACVQTCPTECRIFGDLTIPRAKCRAWRQRKRPGPSCPKKGSSLRCSTSEVRDVSLKGVHRRVKKEKNLRSILTAEIQGSTVSSQSL